MPENPLITAIRTAFRIKGTAEHTQKGPTRAREARDVLEAMVKVGPNFRPDLLKQVGVKTHTPATIAAGRMSLEELLEMPELLCLQTRILVESPPPGESGEYVVVYDSTSSMRVYREATFRGEMVRASVVPVESPLAAGAGVLEFDPFDEQGYEGPDANGRGASVVRRTVNFVVLFYSALQPMQPADFPGGYPVPGTPDGAAYWREASPPNPTYRASERIKYDVLLFQADDQDYISARRTYIITDRPNGTETVYAEFDTTESRICESARVEGLSGLWRYDLTTDELTPVQGGLDEAEVVQAVQNSDLFALKADPRFSIVTRGPGPFSAQTNGVAGGYAAVALSRAGRASQAHGFSSGYYTYADTNAGTAMGYRTWAKAPAGTDGGGTYGQYAGGAGAATGNVAPDTPGSFPIISGGYASFNHSNNNGQQGEGHGALAPSSAILGGYNANIPASVNGAVLLASENTKVPTQLDLAYGDPDTATYNVFAPGFVSMRPGGAFYLASPDGKLNKLQFNNARELVVNNLPVSSGGGGGGSSYALPAGSATTRGGFRLGTGLTVTNGDVLNAAGGGGGIDYTSEVVHTQDVVLTAADLEKSHVLSGNTALTLTLPAADAGKRLSVRVDRNSTAVHTVAAAAGQLVDGVASRGMWAQESMQLVGLAGGEWQSTGGRRRPMRGHVRRALNNALSYGVNGFGQLSMDEPAVVGLPLDVVAGGVGVKRSGYYTANLYAMFENAYAGQHHEPSVKVGPPGQPANMRYVAVGSAINSGTPSDRKFAVCTLATQPFYVAAGEIVEFFFYTQEGVTLISSAPSLLANLAVTEVLD